jgi:probable phosphoglycerate mutase
MFIRFTRQEAGRTLASGNPQPETKTYILVAHNGISRVIQSYFYDMTNEEYAAFGVKNCEILKYEF